MAVPVGLAVAYVLDRRRAAAPEDAADEPDGGPSNLRSLGVAGGVVGGLAGLAYGEHVLATLAGRGLASVLPGGPQLWKLAGHGVTLALLGSGAVAVYGRAMRKIEAGTSAAVPVLEADEATRWTGPSVSGGADSLVPWDTLGREGRRHALLPVRPQPVADRPLDTPDLSIETVMGEPARATPVQVYVGLDSAPNARERVDLALAEMERTGAFDRSLIMLVSPTGTGYVNYVAVAAAQYLSRGDVATVTMQYSKRPSPLSLGKVKDAREQNRLLWLRILERLRDRPGPRPRVVLFGESLGAHTSQDVFLHWGTLGPEALGIDRALWIGTPYGSGWMHEVTSSDELAVDRDRIAVVNDFAQFEELGDGRRSRVRYVLVSHDNDGVTKFGTDLLVTAPRWLGADRPRPAGGPRGQPAGDSAGDALAADHHVLPESRRHEERADPRRLPGLGARLPTRPGPVHQRGLRPARQPRAARRHRGRPGAARDRPRAPVRAAARGQRRLIAQTRAAARTPRPFVAQCNPMGASRLPLARRSSANRTPATVVKATVPRTVSSSRRLLPRAPARSAVFVRARSRAGSTCHSPKRTDETEVAQTGPWSYARRPHSTPRNATSSKTTVASGTATRAA